MNYEVVSYRKQRPPDVRRLTLLMLVILLPFSVQACEWDEVDQGGTCTKCYRVWPGCWTCDSTGCLSCQEAMFIAQGESKVCVTDCSFVTMTTYTEKSKFFADSYRRKCYRCGENCSNCVDDVGCVSCETGSSVFTSVIKTIDNGWQQCQDCSTVYPNCSTCTDTECTSCVGKELSAGSCGDDCAMSNCNDCNADKNTCNRCNEGFVLDSNTCVEETCLVSNCMDCASPSATDCIACKPGFVLSSSTVCDACPTNCLDCSGGVGTCDLCDSGFIISQDGSSCVSECESDQFVEVSNPSTKIGNVVEKKTCTTCHSSCENCVESGESGCTKCVINKYLDGLYKGTCKDKGPLPDNEEIIFYVGNLPTNYAVPFSDRTGETAFPDTNLMTSISRVKEYLAPYTTFNNGSQIHVQIRVFQGDHYMLYEEFAYVPNKKDFYTADYHLEILPYYCLILSGLQFDSLECIMPYEFQYVKIYNKVGITFGNIVVPQKLTISYIYFEMIDSLIPPDNDPDNCLTRRKRCCEWDSAAHQIGKFNSTQNEECVVRYHLTEWCHREQKNSMFTFHPYHTDYGMTSTPPELVIDNCFFNDMFYEFNALIFLNTEAHVTITNTQINRLSNCGSIIKKKPLSQMNNVKTIDAVFTQFVNNINQLPPETVATDHSCTGATPCFKLKFVGNSLSEHNYYKFVAAEFITNLEGKTNGGNGMEHIGDIFHFDEFDGPIYIMNNTFSDIRNRITSTGQYCSIFNYSQEYNDIYGDSDTFRVIYFFFLDNIERDIVVANNNFESIVTAGALAYINKGNKYEDSVIIFDSNTVNKFGSMYFSNGFLIHKKVSASFEGSDPATWTSLPCKGIIFTNNIFTELVSSPSANSLIKIMCLTSTGDIFKPSLTNEQIADMSLPTQSTFTYTYDTYTLDIDYNYTFIFSGNKATMNMGVGMNSTYELDGLLKVLIRDNIFANNSMFSGTYAENSFLWEESVGFAEWGVSECDGNSLAPNSYGFIKVNYGHHVHVVNNSVHNHGFINGFDNEVAEFGAFMYFINTYGNVMIDNLSVSNITGLFGDYNINVLKLADSLIFWMQTSNSTQYYASVPVFYVGGANIIKTFSLNDITFEDSIFYYAQNNYAGMFIHVPYDLTTNTVGVQNLTVTKFSSRNVYNYDSGSLIHKYGDLYIDDANFTEYGITKPTENGTATKVPAIVSILRPDHSVTLNNVGFFSSTGGVEGSALLVKTDNEISVTATSGPHFTLESMNITMSKGLSSLVKFDIPNIIAKVIALSARNNIGIGVSVISIINGGTLDLLDLDMLDNEGPSASDITISSCATCSIRIINSTFSRSPLDTSGSPTFDKSRSIDASMGGNFQVLNSTFSNYHLIEEGSVMKFNSMTANFESCNFTNNVAKRGGVFSISSDAHLILKTSRFINNIAFERAGSIFGRDEISVNTENSIFSGNQAPTDAVFYLELNVVYNDINSVFEQNIATQANSIGSIIQGSAPGTLEGSSFLNNTVTGSEGILLYLLFNEITFKDGFLRDNVFNDGNKNIYGISSTITFENFTFSNNALPAIDNEDSEGGFIYLFLCVGIIRGSTFTKGIARDGGAIYSFSSSLTSEDNTFIDCRAKTGGGAIFSYSITSYSSTNDIYINNKAGSGDAIGMILVNDLFEINNSSFQSDSPSQFIDSSESTVLIKNSTFEQTSNYMTTNTSLIRNGAGIWVDSTTKITAQNNTFRNLRASSGSFTIEDHVNGQDVDDIFGDSKAPGEILVGLQNNTFDGCESFGTGGGAGVYYECTLNGCELNFNGDLFENMKSHTIGGGISWTYYEPTGIQTAQFSNNTATEYGDDIAGVPTYLKAVSAEYYNSYISRNRRDLSVSVGDPYPNSTINDCQPGGLLPTVYLGIFDGYDNLVKHLNEGELQASVTGITGNETYTPFLTFTTTISVKNGLFNINNLIATAEPGESTTIMFTTELIDSTSPSNVDYYESKNLSDGSISMKANFRECESGEAFLDDGGCEQCEADVGYLLVPPKSETTCIPCPSSYAQCLGGNKIVPKAGFWRASNMTDSIIQCPNTGACLGYSEETPDLLGECQKGYMGITCSLCSPDYSSIADFECGKCPDPILNAIRIGGFLFFMVVVIIILIKFTIQGSGRKRNIATVYNRIILNHVQMLVIIYGLDLDWPDNFMLIYQNAEPVAEAPQQFISFDCFIDKRTDSSLDANTIPLFFIRVIIACILPVLVILLNLIFWYSIYIYYKSKVKADNDQEREEKQQLLCKQRKRRILASILVVMIFLHPSITELVFELFNCSDINNENRLKKEPEEICYEGSHLTYVLILGIPSCIVWVFGTLAYSFVKVKLSQRKLHKIETKEEIGYLYNGYLKHACIWETVIILKKTLLIGIGAFFGFCGKKVQGQFAFGLLMASALLHIWVKPYATMKLNVLEFLSIMALTLSALAGVFFVTDDSNNIDAFDTRNGYTLNSGEKLILFLLFLFSNIFFFICWGVLYISEFRRILRVRIPKAYYAIFLCNNELAIEREATNRKKFIRIDNTTELYIDAYDTCLKTAERLKRRVKYKNLLPILGIAKLGKNYMRMRDVNKLRVIHQDQDQYEEDKEISQNKRADIYITENEADLPALDFNPSGTTSSLNKSKKSNSSKGLLKSKTNKVAPIALEEEKEDILNKTQNELLNENKTLSDIDVDRSINEMNKDPSLKLTDKIIKDIIEERKEQNDINPTFDQYQNGIDMQPIEEEQDLKELQDIDGTIEDQDLSESDRDREDEKVSHHDEK
ncbi:unnamed protein product [Moneuplotes crassus]|uniref:EGF-like domain-containing protein n=1 Tax=Euplotes crassus TaxID=5936 RepID=A0AAD1Y9B7_EUPCR|nr:unnamed protein product [Moneuplotes crassus]